MTLFLSTYINKLDKKNRVSVPAQFRAVVKSESFIGVVLYPAIHNKCLIGCAFSRMEKISEVLDTLDSMSEEQSVLSTVILGESVQLEFDNEGRINLPKFLSEQVGIVENVVFVGKGKEFEIWNERNFEEHRRKSRAIIVEKNMSIPSIARNAK